MAEKQHRYIVDVRWTGNTGEGTRTHRGYERAYLISAVGKVPIEGSSISSFRGHPVGWNPEELLVASLSACHQLWYLGLCASNGVVVTAYEDAAQGCMVELADGAGQFTAVTLNPRVTVSAGSDVAKALALHERAHAMCFIARSVSFPVTAEPTIGREAPDRPDASAKAPASLHERSSLANNEGATRE